MPYELPNTWRRRKRQAQGGADVYTYDSVPRQLRVQVVQILGEGLGAYWTTFGDRGPTQHLYEAIVRLLRRELGRHSLVQHQGNTDAELMTWFEAEKDVDAFLEGIEICMRLIDVEIRTNWQNYRSHV
ncbi:MAG TPA: hypothetical protein VHD15_09105, partial [Hyphomicrobiales bacterium]|nr:hypothetical protein [Hyphomicrobiales bacterium]